MRGGVITSPRPSPQPSEMWVRLRLQKQDVLVFQRDPFVGQPTIFVATVASAVDAGVFASMAILPGSELRTAAQAKAVATNTVETMVEQGTLGGFAFLIPSNSSRLVCR